jgi:hypothetical protein
MKHRLSFWSQCTIIPKTSTLSNEKKFNQENSKSTNPFWQNAKKAQFFISNVIILQSTRSKYLKIFPRILLVIRNKILQFDPFKEKEKNQFFFLQ